MNDARSAPALLDVHRLRVVPEATRFALDVSGWRVSSGECVALIGKNGSGKSSLMEACLGLRHARILEGSILGAEFAAWPRRAALRHDVGALLQRTAPPPGLYVRDLVSMHRQLYRRSSLQVHDALGLGALASRKFDMLSRGEVQRVELFMALAHEPKLAFLDEPFTGLDAHFAAAASALIAQRGERAIVMCCHGESELALASRIAWMADGCIQADATPAQLRRQLLSGYRLRARFADEESARGFARHPQVAGAGSVRCAEDGTVSISSEDERVIAQVRALLATQTLLAFEAGSTTLTDLLAHCAATAGAPER